MYKLIVCDMDGTLLNSVGEISRENIDAIKKVQARGIEFAIVTGRPYASVKGLLVENDLKCAVIGCNGAQVTDKNGTLIKFHYLEKESLNRVLRIAEDEEVYYQLYDDFYIYTKSRIQMLKVLKNYSKKSLKGHINLNRIIKGFKRLFFAEVKVKKNLFKFASQDGKRFYKIQIASMDQGKLNSVREKIKDIPYLDITSSAYYNLEIGPSGVTKGTALKELAQIKNIKPEEIIAMGDNYNDIPMLEFAGCGVVMENGEEEVKSKGDFHTKSNDNNGVAYAIEKLIFKNK